MRQAQYCKICTSLLHVLHMPSSRSLSKKVRFKT